MRSGDMWAAARGIWAPAPAARSCCGLSPGEGRRHPVGRHQDRVCARHTAGPTPRSWSGMGGRSGPAGPSPGCLPSPLASLLVSGITPFSFLQGFKGHTGDAGAPGPRVSGCLPEDVVPGAPDDPGSTLVLRTPGS